MNYEASGYLAFLASIRYQLSAIEQAVADQTTNTGGGPTQAAIIGTQANR